jgi:hypothetical protein
MEQKCRDGEERNEITHGNPAIVPPPGKLVNIGNEVLREETKLVGNHFAI